MTRPIRVVLLRGILRDRRHWNDWPQRLQQSLPQAQIETPDLAGNGIRYQERSPASVAAMVDDLRQQIEPLHDGEQVLLVTISMGGMIASCWAERFANEVAGAVLINASMSRFSPFYQRLNPAAYASAIKAACTGLLAKEQWVLRWTSLSHSHDADLARAWTGYANQAKPSLLNSLRQLWAAARFSGPATAPPVPLMILTGQADRLVNPKCSLAIAKAWRCRMVSHPQAGHDLPLDQPQWVCQHVAQLVAKLTKVYDDEDK